MSERPFISILMNCHNGEDFLKESIESAIEQSYQNWELIFFDNASNDFSKKIFDTFSDKRLKYLYQPIKTSLVEARNHAITKASGDWIAILDTDDSWHRNKLDEQINALKAQKDQSKVGLIYTSAEIKFGSHKTKLSKSYQTEKILDSLLSTKLSIPWSSALFNKKLFYQVDGFDERFPSFHDFALELSLALISQIIFINKPLTLMRVHKDSLSARQNLKGGNYFAEISSILKEYFPRQSAIDGYYILTVKSLISSLFQLDLIAFFKKLTKLGLTDAFMCLKALFKLLTNKS